ncbi:MAG TPA: thermonuclease family protein [Candidatus Limnocylindrales bacterium]|nr:thermonuclease family protein [Candidatus Limnocylindrales bacterium]
MLAPVMNRLMLVGTMVLALGCSPVVVQSPPVVATRHPVASASATVVASTFAPSGPTEEAEVVRVVDGDTIVVDLGGFEERVRYIGIDAPESVRPSFPVEEWGVEASAANADLVEGRTVVLERDVSDTDRFGRLLRYVWLLNDGEWLLVNLELVRLGYANAGSFPPDVKYNDEVRAAEREARDADRGLWGLP